MPKSPHIRLSPPFHGTIPLMTAKRLSALLFVTGVILTGVVSPVHAQGIIWSLPVDGRWVRYEGSVQQTEFRPNSTDGDIEIKWIRKLTISSVGTEMADYDGEMTACRWIEIIVLTGKDDADSPQGVDTGPVGRRILKVLVPEKVVAATTIQKDGKIVDNEKILVSHLPIVKGYRKIGDGAVKPIQAKVLQVYPMITLMRYYRTLEDETGEDQDPGIRLVDVTARKYNGLYKMESPVNRTTNRASLWLSNDVPFGLAKWTVTVKRETKDSTALSGQYKEASEIKIEMSARVTGEGAQSILPIPEE